jgi:hypothetical protein
MEFAQYHSGVWCVTRKFSDCSRILSQLGCVIELKLPADFHQSVACFQFLILGLREEFEID